MLINAVLGEDVPGEMRWSPKIWWRYWTYRARFWGFRSLDPVRRSQDMINLRFPRLVA